MAIPEIEDIRILEIGQLGLFKTYFPTRTHFFDTSNGVDATAVTPRPQDPDSLLELGRLMTSGDFDLFVCMPASHSPWHWQTLTRTVFDRRVVANLRRPLRQFGPQLLRFQRRTPLAVVDFADTAYIERSNFFLLDRARLYFKRELPADEWKLLTKTASGTQPTAPVSPAAGGFATGWPSSGHCRLGCLPAARRLIPEGILPKRTDIFFAGTVEGMPVRERALKELAALRDEGFVIDIPDQPHPTAGVLSSLRAGLADAVARRLWLGLFSPLRGGCLRIGAADQPAADPPPRAAARRRTRAVLRPGAGVPCRPRKTGAGRQGPVGGDRRGRARSCVRQPH